MEYQPPLADWQGDTWQHAASKKSARQQAGNGALQTSNGEGNGALSAGNSGNSVGNGLAVNGHHPYQHTHQQTLQRSITATGIGLHSGEEVTLTLSPAPIGSGLMFRRHDLADAKNKQATTIPALASNVSDVDFNTSIAISRKVRIATIEHVMAALAGADIDNAYIDVAGAELPAFDGSAAYFSDMIAKAGIAVQTAARQYLKIRKPVSVAHGKSRLSIAPADGLRISATIDFSEAFIGTSQYVYDHSQHNFVRDLAAARTFCLYEHIAPMHAKGYAFGGSLENAIVIRDGCMLNKEPLRFADEFVRHKILDCLGDLRLAGYPVLGHVTAYRPGHRINAKLVKAILDDRKNYAIVTPPVLSESHVAGVE